jgi:hypothetical protein
MEIKDKEADIDKLKEIIIEFLKNEVPDLVEEIINL